MKKPHPLTLVSAPLFITELLIPIAESTYVASKIHAYCVHTDMPCVGEHMQIFSFMFAQYHIVINMYEQWSIQYRHENMQAMRNICNEIQKGSL